MTTAGTPGPDGRPDVRLDLLLEVGRKRVFASATDWPGGARSGRDEATAVAGLLGYADRYAVVASAAGVAGS